MKIVLVGLRLTVGTRLVIDTLGVALTRLGHDVVFVGEAHTPPPPVRAIAVSSGASYPAMLAQTMSPAYHRGVVDVLLNESPDVCYFYSVHPANGFLCAHLRRAARAQGRRVPVIAAHIHDPLPHPGLAWPLIFGTHFAMARTADRVVAFGQALADQISRLYCVARHGVIVVPHGASRPPRIAPPPHVPSTQFCFLGRIDGYKGLDVFLAAAQEFRRRRGDARFFVGGSGSLAPYRHGLEVLGSSVTVENRELTNDETDRVMRASWAVVLPYKSGTQSGVIPVAYWNACPVITTRVGSLPELVSDGQDGFVVAPRDAAALVTLMSQLWGNDGLRQTMGKNAFQRYDRTLRWDSVGAELLASLS